jgi:hypothetical protein
VVTRCRAGIKCPGPTRPFFSFPRPLSSSPTATHGPELKHHPPQCARWPVTFAGTPIRSMDMGSRLIAGPGGYAPFFLRWCTTVFHNCLKFLSCRLLPSHHTKLCRGFASKYVHVHLFAHARLDPPRADYHSCLAATTCCHPVERAYHKN